VERCSLLWCGATRRRQYVLSVSNADSGQLTGQLFEEMRSSQKMTLYILRLFIASEMMRFCVEAGGFFTGFPNNFAQDILGWR
jgi:hypothetical protein